VVQHRVRIRFAKQHDLRLISHRDLARALHRVFRRAGIAVAPSEGFHPKPRMSFPAPLALGIAGVDEVLEVELAEPVEPSELLARLAVEAPAGLTFHAAEALPQGRTVQVESQCLEIPLPSDRVDETRAKAAEFLAVSTYNVQRPERPLPIDVRPLVEELLVEGPVLRMRLRLTHEAGVRPRDVLEALGLADLPENGAFLTRTHLVLQNESNNGGRAAAGDNGLCPPFAEQESTT
jgi:radical SAM-linked protein